MGPVEVAVGVDHLRLDPDAELHAQGAHVLDQRCEAVGVGIGRHPPVTEAGAVVAAAAEPAVVEDEALDADRRGALGEAAQRVEVVVEVHRLPRVEHDRSRRARGGRATSARRRGTGGSPDTARRSSARRTPPEWRSHSPGRSTTSPGCSSSPTCSNARPSGRRSACRRELPLHARCTPHTSPRCSPKPAVPAHSNGGVLVRRAAATVLGEERRLVEGAAARMELAAPPTVQRQQFGDVGGERQRQRQVVEPVIVVTDVVHLGAEAHGATGVTAARG